MQFKKWIFLLSTSCAFSEALPSVDLRSMEQNQAELVGQNAKLLEAQQQLTAINSDPERKLAYVKELFSGFSEKDEFEKANRLEGEDKTKALEKLYKRKQIENADLRKRQDDIRLNPPPNAPDTLETTPSQYAEEEARLRQNASLEVDGQPYKDSFPRGRQREREEDAKEVSSYDIQRSMRDNRRPKNPSGPAISATDLQAQGRVTQTTR